MIMDPNKTLKNIRKALYAMGAAVESDNDCANDDYADAAGNLMDHVAALDDWLSKGGFLPDAWAKNRPPKTP